MEVPPHEYVTQLLACAREAAAAGEVPVAAMVLAVEEDRVRRISLERNRIVERRDPTAHAELLALRAACTTEKSERLSNAVLLSSLEPCMMCTGAAVLARVRRIFYCARSEKGAPMSALLEWERGAKHGDGAAARLNHYPDFVLLEEYRAEYGALLREFFRAKRA